METTGMKRRFGIRRRELALVGALLLAATACGNSTAAGGNDTVEFDALDVDFDALDVDVNGIDIAGFKDLQQQDTIGNDVSPPDVQADVPPPECVTSATCSDDTPCTNDSCVAGKCVHANNTAACEDGSKCTTGDACVNGACVPGSAPNCSDENPCTDDSCAPDTGCVHAPNAVTCSDGSVCTTGDVCSGGACLPGAATVCDDGNLCTDDSCDPATGCTATANAAACDDGDPCTISDHCTATVCGGSPNPCDDNNVCTADGCNVEGCFHTPTNEAGHCDDSNICTVQDTCWSGTCVGYGMECGGNENPCAMPICDLAVGCTFTSATGSCDDGDPCTQVDTCNNFMCLGSDVTDCNDANPCTVDKCTTGVGCDNTGATNCDDGNSCTADSCDLALGCTHETLPGESPCDDGNACTQYDTCTGDGQCAISQPVTCDDTNVCTSDSCDPKIGCVFMPLDVTCDDNNSCTTGDFCDSGYCVGGLPTDCNDGNPCTDDSCATAPPNAKDLILGCSHLPNSASCDDGNPCTGGDYCSGTVCYGGDAPGCDDLNACTNDFCSTAAPGCGHTVNTDISVCDDGNACTSGDSCNTVTGACVGATAVTCSDGDPCTSDACDPVGGCLFKPICDDGDPCTTDVCSLAGDCTHTELAVFQDSFANGNAKNWTLGPEWQIGAAALGPAGNLQYGDPATGADDGWIAGVDIGGNAKRVLHDFYFLTSPVIDTTSLTAPTLQFWRWLDSDSSPYMDNIVQAWDGTAWQTLWEDNGMVDSSWQRQVYDLTALSNKNLQFRIGFSIGDTGVYSVGSWNVDKVTVGESGQCVPPNVSAAPKPMPVAAPHLK